MPDEVRHALHDRRPQPARRPPTPGDRGRSNRVAAPRCQIGLPD